MKRAGEMFVEARLLRWMGRWSRFMVVFMFREDEDLIDGSQFGEFAPIVFI